MGQRVGLVLAPTLGMMNWELLSKPFPGGSALVYSHYAISFAPSLGPHWDGNDVIPDQLNTYIRALLYAPIHEWGSSPGLLGSL